MTVTASEASAQAVSTTAKSLRKAYSCKFIRARGWRIAFKRELLLFAQSSHRKRTADAPRAHLELRVVLP